MKLINHIIFLTQVFKILVILSFYHQSDALTQGTSYPSGVKEIDVCGSINSIIERNDIRFHNLVINNNSNLTFPSEDSRYMIQRLANRLSYLWLEVEKNQINFVNPIVIILEVVRAWTDKNNVSDSFNQNSNNSFSLHYEGRSAQLRIKNASTAELEYLADLAIMVAMDFVYFPNSQDYIIVSVIKDECRTALDLLLTLDGSGSVGAVNFETTKLFVNEIVNFFDISPETTQIAVLEYSSNINNVIYLNQYNDSISLKNAISSITYQDGGTETYRVIEFTYTNIFTLENGMREKSKGFPRVAVFMTDGVSNGGDITPFVEYLHENRSDIQVYSVGIGNGINENELIQIAGSNESVFLLTSFSNAFDFVNRISYRSCDTAAIVNEIVETDVDQGEFRYFQAICDFVANNITIEVSNVFGNIYVYVSNQLRNPGPLSDGDKIQKIENDDNSKLIEINFSEGVNQSIAYISVQGREEINRFVIYIYDSTVFQDINYEINIGDDVPIGYHLITISVQSQSANFTLSFLSGNDNGEFTINQDTGQIFTNKTLTNVTNNMLELAISAQDKEYNCHIGKTTLSVKVTTSKSQPIIPEPILNLLLLLSLLLYLL